VAAAISYSRRHGAITDEVIDAHLLKAFPGRTLDELDSMDYGRYRRAIHAQSVMDIEDVGRLLTAGKVEASKIAPEVLEALRNHNALIGEDTDFDGDE
jgi:hypothetical protein